MGPCRRGLVPRRALHQPVLHQAEHGFADHLGVAALWGAPTRERELTPLCIPAGKLQQRGVHLAMPLPLLPQPEPIPRDGVGAGVCLQRVGIAEDGGSPHIDPAAALVLVDDSDHGLLLSCTPLGVALGVASGVKKQRSSSKGFFFGLCAAAVHLRVPVLPPDRQILPWRRGVKHAVRPLAAKAAGCCGIFLFLPPSCAVPILAEQAMSRVRWRTEQSEACPGRGPARITLRVLRRKKKRRSNRQPRAAARGRPLPWCPAATAGGQGKEHATRHWCPAAHSPASKRPFVQPRSAATDEGCGGTLPPRCPPAHARAASGTRVRRHHRGLEGLTLTQEPYGSTLQSLPRREERPQRDRGRSEE